MLLVSFGVLVFLQVIDKNDDILVELQINWISGAFCK
jgi:hypothetical protein